MERHHSRGVVPSRHSVNSCLLTPRVILLRVLRRIPRPNDLDCETAALHEEVPAPVSTLTVVGYGDMCHSRSGNSVAGDYSPEAGATAPVRERPGVGNPRPGDAGVVISVARPTSRWALETHRPSHYQW
jgi:hypothetical protein